MADVGLVIGFGVLTGARLHAIGAFRKVVTLLVNGLGDNRLPAHVAARLPVAEAV